MDTATTLSNIQILLMVEDVMNACENRPEWDATTRKVFLSMHTAWHALVDANTPAVLGK